MVLIFAIAEVMVLCGGQPTVAMSGAVKMGIEPKEGFDPPGLRFLLLDGFNKHPSFSSDFLVWVDLGIASFAA